MKRPLVGQLIVPYMVDDRIKPIDFKIVHGGHVRKCAECFLCGICGTRIRGYFAFIGPNDERRCFADPWMHPDCARLAMQQCPFLAGRRDWRAVPETALEGEWMARYSHNMSAFVAPSGRAHRDQFHRWHFEALGALVPVTHCARALWDRDKEVQ